MNWTYYKANTSSGTCIYFRTRGTIIESYLTTRNEWYDMDKGIGRKYTVEDVNRIMSQARVIKITEEEYLLELI